MSQDNHIYPYRPEIDSLRAIAIIAVIKFHTGTTLNSLGFLGVDIFFVISGFLITNMVHRDINNNRFKAIEFYGRRIRRLFPTLIIVLTIVFLLGFFLMIPQDLKILGKQIACSSLLVNNFCLLNEVGYFELEANEKPLIHLWSLSLEEQFYLFFPFLITINLGKRRQLLRIFGLISLISLITYYKVSLEENHHFYLPHVRIWEMLLGGIVAIIEPSKKTRIEKDFASMISLIILILVLDGWLEIISLEVHSRFLIVFATALFIYFSSETITSKIISIKPIRLIGLFSYPLYLIHWPLISFAKLSLNHKKFIEILPTILFASVIISYLIYIFVEKKIRIFPTNKTTPILITLNLTLFSVGLATYISNGFENRDFYFTTKISPIPFQKEQSNNCKKIINFAQNLDYCYLSKKGLPTIVIIGDSHAENFYHGFEKYFLNSNENILILGKNGCPTLLDTEIKKKNGSINDCKHINNIIINYILDQKHIKKIFFAIRGIEYLKEEKWEIKFESGINNLNESFKESMINTFSKLSSTGKELIIVKNVPELKLHPKKCFLSITKMNKDSLKKCQISINEHRKKTKKYDTILTNLKRNVTFKTIDPAEVLCRKKICEITLEGESLYRDDNHLSFKGSLLMTKLLEMEYFFSND